MDVVKNAVEHVNPGQTPVVTLDQSLFALAKQIQWKWPEKYGEGKMVVMFGGLHIEMAALKEFGVWLRGSGWVQALVQAEIATPGTADSFLRAPHGTRTRRAHQITAHTATPCVWTPSTPRVFSLGLWWRYQRLWFLLLANYTQLPVGLSCVRRCWCERTLKSNQLEAIGHGQVVQCSPATTIRTCNDTM